MQSVLPRTHHYSLRWGVPLIVSLAAFVGTDPKAWAACACTSMTVSHANSATVTICSNNVLNFGECMHAAGSSGNGCAGSTFAYTCPVGINSASGLTQKTGFAVDAALTGTASECQSGQALQLTITSNESVSKPKVLATPSGDVTIGSFTAKITNDRRRVYPNVGTTLGSHPLFGADSYTNPAATDLLIHETANGIKWWDNTDQTKDKATENATWQYRFYSYVQGSSGQNGCACVFDIDVNWPANAAAATTFTEVGASSTSCNF
jgi:hypothetical protein